MQDHPPRPVRASVHVQRLSHCTAGAVTLEQAHMQPQAGPAGLQRAPAAEQQLWTYLTQLAMALRALHTAGLAVGPSGLAATKVLLTSRATARIKIGMRLHTNACCGAAAAKCVAK